MRVFKTLDIAFPPGSACVALGLFDGLHPGHLAVIRAAVDEARRAWKIPCVFTFNTDEDAPEHKSSGRLVSAEMMEAMLEELGVECVVRPDFSDFRELSPALFVSEVLLGGLGATSVLCGDNFRFGKNAAGSAADLAALCDGRCAVTALPMVARHGAHCSSSGIRYCLQQGDVEEANAMLGRRFAIDFEVVHGLALGRTLGSPTINQPFPPDFVRLRFGVYATLAWLDGKAFAAVTNVGIKPTVGSDRILAETWIQGFSGDLYGRRVRVEFLSFIRPERKFPDVDALKRQIMADSAAAAEIADRYAEEAVSPPWACG